MLVLEYVLLLYFGYVTLYSFTLGTAGLLYKSRRPAKTPLHARTVLLIPAYKEDSVIVEVARQALMQNYPADRFEVVVIADSLKTKTLELLRQSKARVIEASFEKSTKVRALNHALQVLGDDYDCAVVLDADNVMEDDFLKKMNDLFHAGYRSVQGKRTPKNTDTPMALLDGLSETINNFVYRQGNEVLGLSCSLSGSGMMFDYKLLKNTLRQMDSIGGFDRELELRLLDVGIKTYYAKNILLYDEKVPNQEVFEQQRKRWISSHFFYLRKYFAKGWQKLCEGNLAYFNSAVLRNMQLPRFLNIGLLALITTFSLIFSGYIRISAFVWLMLLTLNVLTVFFAIPRSSYNMKLLRSVVLLPRLFLRMFLLLFKLKQANKTFLHTPHGMVESKEVGGVEST